MLWKELEMSGWGRTPAARVMAARPERPGDVLAALRAANGRGIIAHGRGRSYGDQALNDGGHVLLTERLNRVTAFDPETGLVECEPGVTIRELLRLFLPRGFTVPVAPGTAFTSIGGAVANDIHGKNHDRAGSFGDHVDWLELMLASGERVRCSAEQEPELYRASVGGAGLTGVITRIALRLTPVAGARVLVREERMADLDAFFAAFEAERETAEFSVGWIDAVEKGGASGRGILEIGRFDPSAADVPPAAPRRQHGVPFEFPSLALNRLSVRIFNHFYLRRVPVAGRERALPLESFLFPLDALRDWNRIYGRRGFHQFQCVIPDAAARAGIGALLAAIAESGAASFLAVLKTLGGPGRGYLSFPLRGYTLALDFPHRRGTAALFQRLEAIVLEHGGRIYLAKDSLLSAAGFAAMYPELEAFREVLHRVDPEGRFQSDMARRLEIRGATS